MFALALILVILGTYKFGIALIPFKFYVDKMTDKTENENVVQPVEKPCSPAYPPTPTEPDDSEVIISEQDFTPDFPVAEMDTMHTKIRKPSWVVPVLPNEELETVLLACIKLVETSIVITLFSLIFLDQYERCLYFNKFCDQDLNSAFEKIICDRAGDLWSDQTHHFIFMNSLLAVQLCACMADKDFAPIMELESRLFNPESKFHKHSVSNRSSLEAIRFGTGETESVSRFAVIMSALPELRRSVQGKNGGESSDLKIFATASMARPLPLLEDFINLFGRLGGFDALLERFRNYGNGSPTLRLFFNYLKPFKACCYYLTDEVVKDYFLPMTDIVLTFMKNLTEADVRQSVRSDQRSNHLADFAVIQQFYQRIYGPNYNIEEFDELHLQLILKTMRTDLFGGKMNALNDLITIICDINTRSGNASKPFAMVDRLVKWLKDNQVLSLLLRSNLHQPQYVEKVTRVVQFLVEMHELSLEDLEEIWEAQAGKHEAIVKNVEDMLARLVHYFSPEQLDRLFDCFKKAFQTTTKRQQERLIVLIRRLTMENLIGLESKTLEFFWDLATRPSLLPEISAAALEAHSGILTDAMKTAGSVQQNLAWLSRFATILQEDSDDYAVIRAARQIIEVHQFLRVYHGNLIHQLTVNNDLITVCINSLRNYMHKYSVKNSKVAHDTGIDSISSQPPSTTSTLGRGDTATPASSTCTNTLELPPLQAKMSDDGGVSSQSEKPSTNHFQPIPHVEQIRERLELLHFLAKESGISLTLEQMNLLWRCLIVDTEVDQDACSCADSDSSAGCSSTHSSATVEGRNICFSWFNPNTNGLIHPFLTEFFQDNILNIKPEVLTPAGMDLFRCFFNCVNTKLKSSEETTLQSQSDLMGLDYLWHIVLASNDGAARIAIEMLRELYTNDRDPLNDPRKLRFDFLKKCYDFLSSSYAKIYGLLLAHGIASPDGSACRLFNNPQQLLLITRDAEQDLSNIDRVIRVLRRFLIECDRQFKTPRVHLPLFQSWSGSSILLTVNFNAVKKGSAEDLKLQKYGATEGRQYESSTMTIIAHANETLGRLRSRLLICRLKEVLLPLNSPATNAGGDEGALSCPAKILDEFCVDLCEATGLSGNLCLSTFLLISSSDLRGNFNTSLDSTSFNDDMKSLTSLSAFLYLPATSTPFYPDGPYIPGSSNVFSLPQGPRECGSFPSMGNCSSSSSNRALRAPRGSPSPTLTDDENVQMPVRGGNVGGDYSVNAGSASLPHSISSETNQDDLMGSPSDDGDGAKSPPTEPVAGANPSSTARGDCVTEASPPSAPLNELRKECNLPDYVMSEDLNFVHLLLDIGNVAVFLGINELRDRTFDVLFSLPMNLTYRNVLCESLHSHKGIEKLTDLLKCSISELNLPCTPSKIHNNLEFPGVTHQLYLLQVLYATLNPSVEIILCINDAKCFSRHFTLESFSYTLAFLRNGGLGSLLSACALGDTNAVTADPLSQLILLWICRILYLGLYCVMATLVLVFDGSTVCLAQMKALWGVKSASALSTGDCILQKYAEAFSHFAVNAGVTMAEIQSAWLNIPPRSCELLRDVIWLISSALPIASISSAHSQRKATIAHSHDSGCISPRTDVFCHPTPPSVTCTFSTTCGLKSAPLQTFFQIGHLDSSDLSIECLQLLPSEPHYCPSPVTLPYILNLNSGRTPGCLSTTALSTLSFLLSLSPDSSLVDFLLHKVPLSHDHEVLKSWLDFLRHILVLSPSSHLRQSATCLLNIVVTCGLTVAISLQPSSELDAPASTTDVVGFVIDFLVKALNESESDQALYSADCTEVLVGIMDFLQSESLTLDTAENLFVNEWAWLSKRITVPSSDSDEGGCVDTPTHLSIPNLFRSHLRLCTCLIPFQNRKLFDESNKDFIGLGPVDALLEVVIFPAAKRFNELQRRLSLETWELAREITSASAILEVSRVISTPPNGILNAAFDLLLKLALFVPRVLYPFLSDKICSLLYSFNTRVTEWEPLDPLPSSNRSPNNNSKRNCLSFNAESLCGSPGFVGLKNAGATCYMNAVLQQLFAILPIRNAILSAPVSDTLQKAGVNIASLHSPYAPPLSPKGDLSASQLSHLCTLFSLQDMFAFLAYTRRAFYDPSLFLRHFKLWGEKVNHSEQHDAQEFLICLVDNLDEAMKICGMPKAIENVIGGTFEDQKICIDCPHRYQREESFLVISVEIQNRSTLCESLEEYVKSDLLEGDNAYHCDHCDKKVAARKRMCIKRLPQILAIQLKRFSFDWERHVAIKTNDRFSFPFELDMAPYTVEGLACCNQVPCVGESGGACESCPASPGATEAEAPRQPTRYTLRGVIVHSGEAAHGHYYSFILHHNRETGKSQWYKYDDTRVTEVIADSPGFEQTEWFGGEYTSETPMRFSYRPYMRCYSAYMLFYEREDFKEVNIVSNLCSSMQSVGLSDGTAGLVPCPPHIASQIYAQNVEHFNTSMLMNPIFEQFVHRLATADCLRQQSANAPEWMKTYEALARLLTHFCFDSRFHTKENNWCLWFHPFFELLRVGPSVREIFTQRTCFSSPNQIHDFFFRCPYPGVRYLYGALLILVVFLELKSNPTKPVADQIMQKLIAELPSCFASTSSELFYHEPPLYGPVTLSGSYWNPSTDDSRHEIQQSACGGQLLALLLDYARLGPLLTEHLARLGLHTKLMHYLIGSLPNTSILCRPLTLVTSHPATADQMERYMSDLDKSIGVDFAHKVAFSSRLLVTYELIRNQTKDSVGTSISFLPPDKSPAFVSTASFKPRLFYLSPSATVHLSPVNHYMDLLVCLFSHSELEESSLNLSNMLGSIDFDRFIQVILTCCLNQGSVVTIIQLIKIVTQNDTYRSRVVIDELMRIIFPSHLSPLMKLAPELAIPVFMEALSVSDSLQELRLSYAFQKRNLEQTDSCRRFYDVLTLIKRSNPKIWNDPGMNMLRALSSMVINFEAFREYFESQRRIGLHFHRIINDVIEVEYHQAPGSGEYYAILNQAKGVLPVPNSYDEEVEEEIEAEEGNEEEEEREEEEDEGDYENNGLNDTRVMPDNGETECGSDEHDDVDCDY
ncbi:putative ubiquitin carboxyl-terminal hydrolase FAF-X [Echinococcus granulosus]|uniref:Ubiquitin carboxyl terminal hydrolase n=1 Tax=Echinococcus granulosus TaxID=6210 RepID=A0A068WWV6_ECHGR|nr:putative ubiquitin carboxyl-terminal hydrolase FAF-X [Echinococcus granulosus]CDS22959.1 ubiquitin carboxyl terminal hydrolase [Echinococcus granulosus]